METVDNKETMQDESTMLDAANSLEESAGNLVDSELKEEVTVELAEQTDIAEPGITEKESDCTMNQLEDISDILKKMSEQIDQMNQLFIQKIAHTTHEEKIVDQMHAELQKYKQDMYSQLVRPILLDITGIRDSIIRMSANYASKPEGEQNVPLKTFSAYAYDIQDLLEKNNITIYSSNKCDEFSPIKHKAIKKITTPVEELHGKIAESLSSGYEYLGRVISPEKVVVYIYEKPINVEGEANNG